MEQNSQPRLEANALILYAKNVTRTYGVSYYFATWFLPRTVREATWLLYAFFRIPDEIVDTGAEENKEQLLTNWCRDWERVHAGEIVGDYAQQAGYMVHTQYDIPKEYSVAFCEAMLRDLTHDRYETYEDLVKYMYGSAASVGLMMTMVMGGPKESFSYAEKLGYAMQLTNFLRDIDEDYRLRNRIYLPQDEMQMYGITETTVTERVVTEEWKDFMQFQIKRSRDLYREAYRGIMLLPKNVQFPILLASNLYEAILTEIEKQRYDIWTRRARTTLLQKLYITVKTLWQLRKQH